MTEDTIIIPKWEDINRKSEEVKKLINLVESELMKKAPLAKGVQVVVDLGCCNSNDLAQQAVALESIFNATEYWIAKAHQIDGATRKMQLFLTPK